MKKLNKNYLAIMTLQNVNIHYIDDSIKNIFQIGNRKFRNVNQAHMVNGAYLVLVDNFKVYVYDVSSPI